MLIVTGKLFGFGFGISYSLIKFKFSKNVGVKVYSCKIIF